MPKEQEKAFWEEIWGCVNIIKIPYDTVMNMPVMDRKNWITRHNYEVELEEEEARRNKDSINDGSFINAYAQMEQAKQQYMAP